jgi:hypothetical protein
MLRDTLLVAGEEAERELVRVSEELVHRRLAGDTHADEARLQG